MQQSTKDASAAQTITQPPVDANPRVRAAWHIAQLAEILGPDEPGFFAPNEHKALEILKRAFADASFL